MEHLQVRQYVVEVVERLDLGTQGIRVVSARGDRDQLEPVLVDLVGIYLYGRGDYYHVRVDRLAGAQTQVALPAGNHQADVTVGDSIELDRLTDLLPQLLRGERSLQTYDLSAVVKTLEVRFQHENLAVVNADSLEEAVTV